MANNPFNFPNQNPFVDQQPKGDNKPGFTPIPYGVSGGGGVYGGSGGSSYSSETTGTGIPTPTIRENPDVYFSPLPGWRPANNPDAVVVYINSAGITTGSSDGSVQGGINILENTGERFQQVSNLLAQSLKDPVYVNQFGQTISYESVLNRALRTGIIQGFSDNRALLTPQEMAKAELLSKATRGQVQVPENLGTYFKGITPEGKEILRRSQPLVPKAYENVQQEIQNIQKTKEKMSIYDVFNEPLKQYITYPLLNPLEKSGLISTEFLGGYTPGLIGIGTSRVGIGIKQPKSVEEIYGNFQASIIKDIKEDPLKNILIYGSGYGLGVGFKGVSSGLGMIPKVGKYAEQGFKGLGLGYGLYQGGEIIVGTTKEIKKAQSSGEIGSILGLTAKDVTLLGLGFMKGEKGFDIAVGEFRTRGLKKLQVEPEIFPQNPIKDQLKLFQENIIKDISNEPVAFHVTSDVFYNKGIITPIEGTSELPGLYASTKPSITFADIKGSEITIPKSIEAFQKAILNFLSPETRPGVAALEPKGFRKSLIGFSDIKQFEGQKYIKGKGYALFEEPPQKGIMEVPGIKTEIESISRVDAGSYGVTGKRFYVEIRGVKVPVDAFKYSEEKLKIESKSFEKSIKKTFKPEKYSEYTEPSSLSSLVSLSLSRSIKSSQDIISNSLKSSERSLSSSLYPGRKLTPSTISRTTPSSVSSRSFSSEISNIGSSISKSISKVNSGLSKNIQKPTKSIAIIIPEVPITTKTINEKKEQKYPVSRKKQLGSGYYAYGKMLKSNQYFKINPIPVTRGRAEDIGSYYVSNTLARSYKITKANKQAEDDYQFMFIPIGYYQQIKGQIRPFKIKKGKPVEVGEVFIQKNPFLLNTASEKRQIQKFRKQVSQILRF